MLKKKSILFWGSAALPGEGVPSLVPSLGAEPPLPGAPSSHSPSVKFQPELPARVLVFNFFFFFSPLTSVVYRQNNTFGVLISSASGMVAAFFFQEFGRTRGGMRVVLVVWMSGGTPAGGAEGVSRDLEPPNRDWQRVRDAWQINNPGLAHG